MSFSYTFDKRGSLGLELIESPTGYAVLKSPGDGQAAGFDLIAQDVVLEVHGQVCGTNFSATMNMPWRRLAQL